MNGRVVAEISRTWNRPYAPYQLHGSMRHQYYECKTRQTFGNGKKTNKNNSIAVHTANIVVNIAHRSIKGVVFIIAGSNLDSCFIATKDDRHKHPTVCFWILSYFVLNEINERE